MPKYLQTSVSSVNGVVKYYISGSCLKIKRRINRSDLPFLKSKQPQKTTKKEATLTNLQNFGVEISKKQLHYIAFRKKDSELIARS
jgi:hypothetical protein